MLIPVLDTPPVIVPVLKVIVFPVVPSMLTTRAALFCVMLPLYVTVGLPGDDPALNAGPVGLVIVVLALKVKLPLDPLRISIPASPPLSVVVPVKP